MVFDENTNQGYPLKFNYLIKGSFDVYNPTYVYIQISRNELSYLFLSQERSQIIQVVLLTQGYLWYF